MLSLKMQKMKFDCFLRLSVMSTFRELVKQASSPDCLYTTPSDSPMLYDTHCSIVRVLVPGPTVGVCPIEGNEVWLSIKPLIFLDNTQEERLSSYSSFLHLKILHTFYKVISRVLARWILMLWVFSVNVKASDFPPNKFQLTGVTYWKGYTWLNLWTFAAELSL